MSEFDEDVHLFPELSVLSWTAVWFMVVAVFAAIVLLVPPHPLWTDQEAVPMPLPASEVTTIAPVFETP